MAIVVLAPDVYDDFDRIFELLAEQSPETAVVRIEEIVQAFDILQSSPLIGSPAEGGKRELVISAGARGYMAVYRYAADMDTVFVLAVHSQLEKRPPL